MFYSQDQDISRKYHYIEDCFDIQRFSGSKGEFSQLLQQIRRVAYHGLALWHTIVINIEPTFILD
jgi:hypothetical protein